MELKRKNLSTMRLQLKLIYMVPEEAGAGFEIIQLVEIKEKYLKFPLFCADNYTVKIIF